MKKILLITLVVFTMFITLITKSNSANALENDHNTYQRVVKVTSGDTYKEKCPVTTEWIAEDHGTANKKNAGKTYYEYRCYFTLEERNKAIDNYVIGWISKETHNVQSKEDKVIFTKEEYIEVSYTEATEVTNQISGTVSSTTKGEIGGKFGKDNWEVSGKVSNEVSKSVTATHTETTIKSSTKTITYKYGLERSITPLWDDSYVAGFYTIQAVPVRLRLKKIDYKLYKCEKNGCDYEWVLQDTDSEKFDLIYATAIVPTDEWKEFQDISVAFLSFKDRQSMYDFAANKNK